MEKLVEAEDFSSFEEWREQSGGSRKYFPDFKKRRNRMKKSKESSRIWFSRSCAQRRREGGYYETSVEH